jgi:hypothetical protein
MEKTYKIRLTYVDEMIVDEDLIREVLNYKEEINKENFAKLAKDTLRKIYDFQLENKYVYMEADDIEIF